jgi:hypothetical protein
MERDMPKIIVNGQSYDSPDDIPASAREAYQKALEVLHDSDGNGVPDFLEGKPLQNVSNGQIGVTINGGSQFVLDGKVYTSLDELPPEARLKYDQAIARLGPLMSDANGNGIPDMLEGVVGRQPVTMSTTTMEIPPVNTLQPSAPLLPQEPPQSVIQEESTNFGPVAVIMLVALIIIGALGAGVYIFLSMAK